MQPWIRSWSAFALLLAACASSPEPDAAPEPRWSAHGWLSPDQSGDPEVIGLYAKRAECEEALADWLASQVVGNPISGECLPIDRR